LCGREEKTEGTEVSLETCGKSVCVGVEAVVGIMGEEGI
jgi:hypothetical protein